jgi:hypothetical protein
MDKSAANVGAPANAASSASPRFRPDKKELGFTATSPINGDAKKVPWPNDYSVEEGRLGTAVSAEVI